MIESKLTFVRWEILTKDGLTQFAADVGMPRQANEGDAALRKRLAPEIYKMKHNRTNS